MKRQLVLCGILALVLAGGIPNLRAGDKEKTHVVGKVGLTLEGTVEQAGPKVKVIIGDKSGQLPARRFLVKLSAGKKYRLSLDSKVIDSVLVVQDSTARQLAFDDDSGGGLNALLTLNVLRDGIYQIYAASFRGSGNFILKVKEVGPIQVHEVGAGLKIAGELAEGQALNYIVKLVAAKAYVIDMISPNQKALDPLLRLLAADGKQLAEDDDGGDGLNARIAFRAKVTGPHQIVATCIGRGRGPFTLTVCEAKKGDLTAEQQQQLGDAVNLTDQAMLLFQQGQAAKATVVAKQALEIRRQVLGENHTAYAISLNNVAFLYRAQGKSAQAEPLFVQALQINKTKLGEKHPAYATSLNNLAELYQEQGHTARAERMFVQALDIRKEVLGEKHLAYATSLNNLATLYQEKGQSTLAEPLFLKALHIHREVVGENDPAYATSLSNLGALYRSQGDFARAEPLSVQALRIRKAVLGEKHPDYATSLNNLALLYQEQGNSARAEPMFVQALQINKAVLGEKHPAYATSLNNLASFYDAQGNSARAEPLFVQVLHLRKEVLGEKHPTYAASLNNLAFLYNKQGSQAKAEPLFVQALHLRKEVLGEKHPDYAQSLNNLAFLYNKRGSYAQAEPLFDQALQINKDVLGVKHPEYATSLSNLAFLYVAQGKSTQAEPLFIQALRLRKAVLGEKHPDVAQSLNNLAALYQAQGKSALAEPLFVQALVASQMARKPIPFVLVQPDDLRIHPQTVQILGNYALLREPAATNKLTADQLRLGDRSFLLALKVLERVRRQNIDHQVSKIQLTAEWFDVFPLRIKFLQKLFSLEQKAADLEAAFWTAEEGTARGFLEALGNTRANLLAGVSPQLEKMEQQLLRAIRLLELRIDKESARTLDQRAPGFLGKLFEERRDAEKKLKQLVARLQKEHPQYAALKYPRPCQLHEARACLAANEVALLFVPGTKASFLVLVEARPKPGDPANGLAIFELPGAKVLAEQVASLTDRETLRLPARIQALGRQTYDLLLGSCKERLQGKHLVIVPGGSLSFLPFELLVAADGKYLVEKHHIRYAPSLTALHLIHLWKQKRAVPEVPLFAIGDPLYDAGKQFPRLVHSGQEVAAIAKLLGAKSDHVLTGKQASEAQVKKASATDQLARARYVHFATHGILGQDQGKQPALVLNLVGNHGEDGFLHMDEITNLKLNADLVVLSACRTGQGQMVRGEGVTGLARAFLYAGSKGVVCSLWSVDDRETANLMVDFYTHLQKGRSAPEALRAAQLAVIRAGKAPLYWAPFIVIGE